MTSTLADFEAAVERFRSVIFKLYSTNVPIVIRTPSPVCCQSDFGPRMYTALRRQRFAAAVQRIWRTAATAEGADRPVFFLTGKMSGRNRQGAGNIYAFIRCELTISAEVQSEVHCQANHALFEHIALGMASI